MNEFTESEEECKILPKDVGNKFFLTAFESLKADDSALIIVAFCQKRKNWSAFSREEIEKFSKEYLGIKAKFIFHNLCDKNDPTNEKNFIILGEDEKYHLTKKFIQNCLRYSPKV